MIIKQASDLHFTYVKNTPELRDAFIAKCNEFDIRVFGFGGENYLEVYSDGYDEFEICGTDDLEPQSKKLTMSDLTGIPTETPEEKEVLDGIESAVEVEWKNGDECLYKDFKYTFIGMTPTFNDFSCLIFDCSQGIKHIDVRELSKPETPKHRDDRERACAIYDMCAEADIFTEESNFWAGKFYDLGYKKEKTHGTN